MNSHGMHETGGEPYFYSNYTWKELREIPAQRRVVLLPVGSTEDHGHHLPLDTDNFMAWTVCVETAKRLPDEVLVMPLIPYGYNLHHVDFPGTICVGAEHFINYVADVCKSIAYHGFKRILIVDGHGSNVPLLDIAARRVILETDALCASFIYTNLIRDVCRRIRESVHPGGMAHACELETSLYLYLDERRVRKSEIQKEVNLPPSKYIWLDLVDGAPLQMMDWWSSFSKTGVVGDPTLATRDKGKQMFDAVMARMVELVREFRDRPRAPRHDMHAEKVQGEFGLKP